jgi:hypothetical protein
MPVTNPADRIWLRSLGHDPDEIDAIVEPDVVAPEPSPEIPVVNPTPKTTGVGSFLREAAREFPSTAAGLAAAGKITALAAPLGIGAPIAGAIGGIGVGLGTRLLQDKLIEHALPESWEQSYKESQATDLAEHPVASTAGRLAASLPFLKPGLKPIGESLTTARKLITGKAKDITKQEAIGSGVTAFSAGLPVGMRAYLDPDASGTELALEGIAGSVLNTPTQLGGKLLRIPSPTDVPKNTIDPNKVLAQIGEENALERQFKAEVEAQPFMLQKRAQEAELLRAAQEAEALKRLKATSKSTTC